MASKLLLPLIYARDAVRLAGAYRVQRRAAREAAWDRALLETAITPEDVRRDLNYPTTEDS